ncbi:MAG TPA: SRPBCC family protein [Paucimonas sp.]|nr:SRPBCC family protein [Paucimonas sp.]
MAAYRFITHWHLEAPLDRVYDAVFHSLEWPHWWQGAEAVEECDPGDADGIGSIRRYTWKSRLPYRIVFEACTTRIERMAVLEATVGGDLQGVGRWLFFRDGELATVRYEWCVETTKRWMNAVAPVARPAFRRNHDWLMQRGAEGLARKLNARLVRVTHAEAPAGPARLRMPATGRR